MSLAFHPPGTCWLSISNRRPHRQTFARRLPRIYDLSSGDTMNALMESRSTNERVAFAAWAADARS